MSMKPNGAWLMVLSTMTVNGPMTNVAWLDSVTRIEIAWGPFEKRLARKDETNPGLGVALFA